MTKVNLKHIARLARLRFRDEELQVFESQVADILKFVEELKSVDVVGVEPTSHPMAIQNVFREDIPIPSLATDNFLKRSPGARGQFFQVPKIIEDKS